MEKPHILQILPMYHPDGEQVLQQSTKVSKFDGYNENEIVDFLKMNKVDGIILRAPAKISSLILNHCQHVKAISGAGVGLDNIDVEYATQKGIPILHAPKLNSQATAEHAVSLILAVMKNIPIYHQETQGGNFSIRDGSYTHELKGKTLSLVGFGTIAQIVAKTMAQGFDMKVLAYVRSITPEKQKIAKRLQVELTTSLEKVFPQGDVVSVHIPLKKETNQLIDARLFSLMKKTAVFINTARGEVIDEEALAECVQTKQIIGAGIDVFAQEPPPPNHPFFRIKEIIVTPHIGGISMEAAQQTSRLIAENLIKVVNGEEVPTIANKQVMQKSGRS